MNAAEIASRVRAGTISAESVVTACLKGIKLKNPSINAFTAVFAPEALAAARGIDAIVRSGGDPGPLAGAPFAVKNLFDVAGHVTLAGSRIQAGSAPAAADAAVVARLKAKGAVLVGALNMDEYAYGFTTENPHYGPTRNPHDPTRIVGGSSGGSAAAVAAGMTPLSLGSDTGGSIRVPAAFCGVFGIKPTFGRLSRRGAFPFVHSLDHVGPFAANAVDLALAYDAMQGPDPLDPACADRPVEPASPDLQRPISGLRVGVLGGWFQQGATAEALSGLTAVAAALGATEAVNLQGAEAARAAAYCIIAAEGGALHLENLRTRPKEFDPVTRDRLIAGAMLPARTLIGAQRYRRRFLDEVMSLFDRFDVLLAPATPFVAPPIGQATAKLGGETASVRASLGLYTQPISATGLPAMTVPVASQSSLPVGVQLIGPPWTEALLLRLAAQLERAGVVAAKSSSQDRGGRVPGRPSRAETSDAEA